MVCGELQEGGWFTDDDWLNYYLDEKQTPNRPFSSLSNSIRGVFRKNHEAAANGEEGRSRAHSHAGLGSDLNGSSTVGRNGSRTPGPNNGLLHVNRSEGSSSNSS